MILIVAIALSSLSPVLLTRISAIVFIYAGVLSFNALDIQSIGSGIGIYSGLFHVTTVSQLIDTFIFIIGSFILVAWPTPTPSHGLPPASPARFAMRQAKPEASYCVVNSVNRNTTLGYAPAATQDRVLVLTHGNNNILTSSVLASDHYADGQAALNRLIQTKLNNAGEYSLIVLFSTLGASLLISSADLISMYLSIELQSFGVYILSTLYRNSESATSAGLKYFLLGSLSSCLILLGTGLIYSFTGLTNLESIYSLVSVSDSSSITATREGLNLGIIIIIVGFLFKIVAAPLHHWAPDVYDDSPTIVTIWLTIMPKISIVIFLLELQTQLGIIGNSLPLGCETSETSIFSLELLDSMNMNTASVLKNLLLISSLLSLIIGTVVGLAQSKIKRLLSYSTISHVGFILLALAINTEQSIDSLIFYIIQYSLTNLNTFLIIIAFGYIIHSSAYFYGAGASAAAQQVPTLPTAPLPSSGTVSGSDDADKASVRAETQNKGSELDVKYISELKGQFFSNPLLSISLTVCLFSMAGIPPLLGFFSKQFVLYSAIQSGYYFMSIVAIIVSVISASYYLKIIKVLHSRTLRKATGTDAKREATATAPSLADKARGLRLSQSGKGDLDGISNFHSFLISTLTLSILLFVLKPSILLNSTQLLSLSLFYY